ncbi:MAG: hypothetical protein IPK06_04485 [Ignavibacteriae bacterium]|nr:hypothetical protein [Ignavibacteriota bacterium]
MGKRKEQFYKNQEKFNSKIDNMKAKYLEKNSDSITEYCDMVLNNSEYPESFPKNFELEYNHNNKILIVEYELPQLMYFQKLKVKFNASKMNLLK